jgi:predicted transcriptional regulator
VDIDDIEYVLVQHIVAIPGIRFLELLRKSGLSNGSFVYHIQKLERFRYIHAMRRNKITRYYHITVDKEEASVLNYLKQHTSRLIVLHLAHNGPCTTNDLMKLTKKTRSTVLWHIKRLQIAKLINSRYSGLKPSNGKSLSHIVIHKLTNKELTLTVLANYRNALDL